jgi:branched-chain amino acid transport system substrate-binding protein
MKVFRYFVAAAGVIAVASVTVLSGTSSAHTTAKVAKACNASIAIEAPLTGPVAQLGLEQLAGAKAGVLAAEKANPGVHVALGQDDTQLTPSIAVTKTAAIVSSNAVAVVGPSGSQEVEAVGPALATAGLAAISGSATNPALTTSGANTSFFRTVATDDVQGPQDANYILKHFKPKGVLIIEDEEVYSTGLGGTISGILTKAGVTVNVQSFNGQDTGATLANDLSSIVASQLNASETVTVMPIQEAADAQQFAEDAKQAGKTTIVFGTDGTDSTSQFFFPGSYVSNFAPDISTVKNPVDQTVYKEIKAEGSYGPFGVPSFVAAGIEVQAIASVCKSGKTPSRANVLAAIRKTDIPANMNPLGQVIKFKRDGDLTTSQFYLFKINAGGKYIQIPSK